MFRLYNYLFPRKINYIDTLDYLTDELKQQLRPFSEEIDKKLENLLTSVSNPYVPGLKYPENTIYDFYENVKNKLFEIIIIKNIDEEMCLFLIQKLYNIKLSRDTYYWEKIGTISDKLVIDIICKMIHINPYFIRDCIKCFMIYDQFDGIRIVVRYIINNLSKSKIHISCLIRELIINIYHISIDYRTDYKIYKLMKGQAPFKPQSSSGRVTVNSLTQDSIIWDPFDKYPNHDIKFAAQKRYSMCRDYISIISLFGRYKTHSPVYKIAQSSIFDKNVFRLIVKLSIKY